MWKFLTFLNTLILLAIVGVGAHIYLNNPYAITGLGTYESRITELEKKLADFEVTGTDTIATDMTADDISPEDDTLKPTNDGIKGYADLSGYTVVTDTKAFFVFPSSSDKTLTEYLDSGIPPYLGSNKNGLYYLALGCDKDLNLVGDDLLVRGDTYAKIIKSSSQSPVNIRVFFGGTPAVPLSVEPFCKSIVKSVQMVL